MFVIGTAGHVDHGKSTLVKILTGIDPDRWEEEQRREMTIDLGFAWLTLPSGRAVSVIDVPGHERFIKNMLAGVGGIDAAMLVIAADESVMPQTEEHLAILDLLGVAGGLVVLTKADLVDPEWLDLVREDVRARLRGTILADAPLVAVSTRTGQGIPELLQLLDARLDALPARVAAAGAARLSIDRAFTIGGFGAVVTGTLIDGPLRIGDDVEVLPRGLRARVRGLQTHQEKVDVARPGARVAVNLAGVSHNDLARGDMLVMPGRMRPTDMLDVELRVIADAARPIVQNARLDLFLGAAEVPCRVTLLDCDELAPGQTGWAQLRLERPIAAARTDRYVVRQASPSRTLGGGRVLDIHPARHRRFRPEVIAALVALARGTPADLLQQPLADGRPHSWAELVRTSGLAEAAARDGYSELLAAGRIMVLLSDANGAPAWVIGAARWDQLRDQVTQQLREYHQRFPLRGTMPREELRSRLGLRGDALDAVMGALLAEGMIVVEGSGVRQPTHVPAPTNLQRQQIDRWFAACATTPYSPPEPDLEPDLQGWLIEQGHVARVAPDLLFRSEAYAEMVVWVEQRLRADGNLTVAQFRDQFGSSRKYALAVLEHLDERKITRRAGDLRIPY